MADFLNADEERALIAKAQAGDESARNTLIERNIGLIYKEALRFAKRTRNNRAASCLGEATIGYMKAIRRFDLNRGVRLSTYAVNVIRDYLRKDFIKSCHVVRVPQASQYGDCSEETLEFALAAMTPPVSLQTQLGGDEGDSIGNQIPDREPDEQDAPMPSLGAVLEIARLPPRWEVILQRRADGATLQKIGEELDLTKERVRQIEADAIAYLHGFRPGVLNPPIPSPAASQPSVASLERLAS